MTIIRMSHIAPTSQYCSAWPLPKQWLISKWERGRNYAMKQSSYFVAQFFPLGIAWIGQNTDPSDLWSKILQTNTFVDLHIMFYFECILVTWDVLSMGNNHFTQKKIKLGHKGYKIFDQEHLCLGVLLVWIFQAWKSSNGGAARVPWY